MLTALVVLTLAAETQSQSVYDLKKDEFIAQAKHDLGTLQMFAYGLHRTTKLATSNKPIFGTVKKDPYTAEQKALLLSTWGAMFSYFTSIEQIRERYWDFVKLSPTDPRHAWGFLLTHTALTIMLADGLTFSDLTQGNPQLETLLDEPSSQFGVPSGSYANFKERSIHVATSTQLMTGEAWGPTAKKSLAEQKALDDKQVQWAEDEIAADSAIAKEKLNKRGIKMFLKNAVDIAHDSTMQAIFPAQKTFAEWAGDTRVSRAGKPFMTPAQWHEVAVKLLPGDVVVVRQNWFLSNIALPGFWPHALLYTGTADDLKINFDAEPEVKKWVSAQPEKATTFTELLSKRYPEKWHTFASQPDFQGHSPIRVIESISEGVSFTAFEHAFAVDYFGAMRPRLSKVEKARAIEHAFKYQGRPYDFDFDFMSDSTLVCTELVYKCYAPAAEQTGLKIELVDVAGRRTLPANEIVKLFDQQYGKPEQQLDFVAFYDASEKQSTTAPSTPEAFRKTWQRIKWDIAQK